MASDLQPAHSKDKHHSSKQSKSRQTKKVQKQVDFNPNLGGDGNADNKKKPAKKKTAHHRPKPKQLASDVNANAVPDPAPDTGITHTYIYYTQSSVHTGILPATPTTTVGFSPLPPLASFATTGTPAGATGSSPPTSIYYTSQSEPTATQTAETSQAFTPHSSKHLSVVQIVVIAVGGAVIVAIIIAIISVSRRPRKRTHPVPSLPILQDEDYIEEKGDGDEESLFGGKERTSARPGSNGILWNWTQYPHVSMSNKSTSKTDTSAQVNIAVPSSKRASAVIGEKTGYPFEGHGAKAPQNPPSSAPIQQQLQAALTKAANRVSAMSVSIYPSSPQSNFAYTDVGVALSSAYPIENAAPLNRNDSKSKRKSVMAPPEEYIVGSGKGYGASLAVPKATHGSGRTGGGRVPVKGPYAPTASMRSSTSLSRVPSASRRSVANPFESSQYALPSQSPIVKSDARRERDTQALTSALGLASPDEQPPSPQTTIYPDDSATLAGDRRRSRNLGGHSRQRSSVMMSPNMEASARLGNLMLTEFQSMQSLPSSRAVGHDNNANKGRAPVLKKRADDRPPRVPSPPPLPSLAQMALAHTNPDDYGDYRSPTYSIYGLYEAERKSRGNDY
ncbi:hypothetical protein EIP91_005170 [Steccherinum ochraceum]|uniref:Uncharacterized protein n=1 Tax=Steccherinum ochraceum TaxID=92696 RepID=A0A4R0RFX4_9APHY|nr:hypothetical protein EIP91_005170 [Steccherinum ochraceum]